MRVHSSIEPGLIRIFRFFVGAEAVAFLMVPLAEWMVLGEPGNFYRDPFYIIFLQSAFLFLYLSVSWLRKKLRHAYLPIALLIAIFIPALVVNIDITLRVLQGEPLELLRIWALLPLLMIPLVPAAWQYEFRTIFVLFAGLGLIDGFYLISLHGGVEPELLMPLFATFIRIVTLSLVGLMITELMHTQREQRRELMRANLQLSQQALVQEQLTISRERNRLARELHDTLAHTLSGLIVQLEATNTVVPPGDENIHKMLDTVLVTARTGMEETRRAMKALRAEPLDDLGLRLAIQNLLFSAKARSAISFHLQFPENYSCFTLDEEQSIYRIVQEALENITRHSKAKNAWISLERDGRDQIVLTIRDDGIGFSPDDPNGFSDRLGLKGMKERASMMGAEIFVQSSPSSGTTIQVIMRNIDDSGNCL